MAGCEGPPLVALAPADDAAAGAALAPAAGAAFAPAEGAALAPADGAGAGRSDALFWHAPLNTTVTREAQTIDLSFMQFTVVELAQAREGVSMARPFEGKGEHKTYACRDV